MTNKELIKIATKKLQKYNCEDLKKIGFLPIDDRFYKPVIIYPTLNKFWPFTEEQAFANITAEDINSVALYIHIPFCTNSCTFCQYETWPFSSTKEIDKYITYLEKNILLWKNRFPSSKIYLKTIYIGGGTPSLLNPEQWKKLMLLINKYFNFKKGIQITADVEPKSVCGKNGYKKLLSMKKYGINRICLGAQCFDDNILIKMRRSHSSKDSINAIKQIRKAGFSSLMLDLLYGYPESTIEGWIDTLRTANSLDIDGYQLYKLRVLPYHPKENKQLQLKEDFKEKPEKFLRQEDKNIIRMINIIISSRSGLKQFSREVFAKNLNHLSKYQRLNLCNSVPAIGIGKGASSSIHDRMFMNIGSILEDYYSNIDSGKIPITAGKILTHKENMLIRIILPLLNCGFVNKKIYKKLTNESLTDNFKKIIEELKKFDLLKESPESIILTEKGGFFIDDTLYQFFEPKEITIPKSAYKNGTMNPFRKEKIFC